MATREELEAKKAECADAADYAELAKKALEDPVDAEYAKELLKLGEMSCSFPVDYMRIEDYKELASSIKEKGDPETARMLYEKASALNEGADDVVTFATGIFELFDDEEWVEQTLVGAEGDCMFPGQFVALARGYKTLLDNQEKVEELLEQGKEFAMSGQENLDLANGYVELLGDQETAKVMYEQALNDFTTKEELLALAGAIAGHMDDKTLAVTAYDKVEEKLSSVADFNQMAQAVNDDLGDKEKVAQIYTRAEARLETPADLISLAAEVRKNLDGAGKTQAIHRKALENSKVYTDIVKLMDTLAGDSADAELVNDLLGKALELAEENAQLLDVAQRSSQLMPDDNSRLIQALEKAEENIGSLDEMRKLDAAVKKHAADDEARVQRVAAKLEQREASQARYIEFQNQEITFTRPPQYIQLAYDVVEELDDASYATQLLGNAEEKMKEESYSLTAYLPFIVAVDHLAKDPEWTERLLDEAAVNCRQFPQVKAIGDTAVKELSDSTFGKEWLRKFYASRIDQLESSDAGAFEYMKMARAIKEHLDDTEWAEQTLDSAAEHAKTHFHYAYIAGLADHWGDADRSQALYARAADVCTDAKQYREIVHMLRKGRVPEEKQRELYLQGDKITDPWKKLRWVEGIVTLFGDKEWAEQAYKKLEESSAETEYRLVLKNSRARRLDDHHFW